VLHVLSGGEAGLLVMLFPQLAGLDLDSVEDAGGQVRIRARTGTASLACRDCGTVTARVQDSYRRRPADLGCGGRPVLLDLQVRRFRCAVAGCAVKTFAEQVPGLAGWYQRRTAGLRGQLERIALAAGGRAGARLASAAGAEVSRVTLTRLVRALPDPDPGPVTVLGVDDIAIRRGCSYATVLMDMDTHELVDMLPDREAGTLASWLRAHPGTEVLCRDRATAYARAARDAAPAAVQVADRFHLMDNLAGAVARTASAALAALSPKTLNPDDADPQDPDDADPQDPDDADPQDPDDADDAGPQDPGPAAGRAGRLAARYQDRYDQVQALRARGLGTTKIAALLKIDRGTAARFARAASAAELLPPAPASPLDPFKPYLTRRWHEGARNAAALHQEIRARGWDGSRGAVQRYLRQYRTPRRRGPKPPPLPRPGQVTRWIMTRPARLDPADAADLARLLDASPALAAAAAHVTSFAAIMTGRQGLLSLENWLTQVENDDQPQLHSFARGIRLDQEAVTAGLALDYSSGPLEGRNCKTKYLKRLMYGRANFDLLRKMALLN
jgi:transposase